MTAHMYLQWSIKLPYKYGKICPFFLWTAKRPFWNCLTQNCSFFSFFLAQWCFKTRRVVFYCTSLVFFLNEVLNFHLCKNPSDAYNCGERGENCRAILPYLHTKLFLFAKNCLNVMKNARRRRICTAVEFSNLKYLYLCMK